MGLLGLGGYALDGLPVATAAGIALAGAAVITALYLLKPRRRRVVVAFAPLWVPAGGERRAERWARRLRRWLSLALQLAVLAALVVAVSDPRPVAADGAGRSVVLLVDRSASMSATDEPGSRLAVARARARALVAGLGAADRALVASFAGDVTAETGFDTDAARLARAIDRVTPSEEPADLPRALAFASSVLRGAPHPMIVLVTDGAFSEDARRQIRWTDADAGGASLAGVDVRWARVGRRGKNVALSGFAARRLPADPATVEASLTVRNFDDAPVDVTLELAAGDVDVAAPDAAPVPVERVRLHLEARETRRHVVPDVAARGARLEARLVERDDLAADDRAYAVVPGLERRRVLLVGDPDLYVDGALLGLGANISVARARAADAEATRPRWGAYDAVIFDGLAPAPAPTAGHFLYLAPGGQGSPFVTRGSVADPVISDVRRGHPLVRQLDLADVNIAEATRLVLEPGDVAAASSFGAPLIVARERPGLRVAALAFDVRRSDLPLRAAFPLFLANALGWLADAGARDIMPAVVGETARVAAPRGVTRVEVTDPTGGRATWPVVGDVVELPVPRAGFYRVGDVTLAANASDPVESDTAPPATLTLGGRTIAAPDAPTGHRHRSIATTALLVAAALLMLEWVTTHRRWTV